MSDELRILILEDVPTDAELMEHALRKAGLALQAQRVDTREGFERALEAFKPDLVLADYRLPDFTGGEALEIVRRTHPEVPLIIVTGSLGDEAAVELVHQGAKDYVLKSNLARLDHAVRRTLAMEMGIRARKAAERELRTEEEKYRAVFTEARDGIVLTDAESGLLVNCNPEFEHQCGRSLAQIRTLHVWELRPPELQEAARRKFEEVRTTGHCLADLGFQRPDGTFMPAEIKATRVRIGDRNYIQSISRDITERKRQAERTAALLELTSLAETLDEKTLLQRGLDTMQHLTDSRIGFIHFVSEDQHEIELVTWSSDTLGRYCQADFDRHYPVSDAGIWADCIRLKQAVIINDYATAPGKKEAPEGHADVKRFVSVPTFEGTQVRMIVGVGNASKDYDEHDVETIQLFSNDLYHIVQRMRAGKSLHESEKRYHQLFENMSSGVAIYQPDAACETFTFKSVNSAVEGIERVKREEVVGRNVEEIFPNVRAFGLLAVFQRVCRSGAAEHFPPAFYENGRIAGWRDNHVYRLDTGEIIAVYNDVTERMAREAQIHNLNRTLRILSNCNSFLIHAKTEAELLDNVCRNIVESGGYRMTRVSYADDNPEKSLRRVAWANTGEDFCAGLALTWADTENGQVPIGQAIRSGTPQICNDIASGPCFAPWKDAALAQGYAANIGLPLSDGRRTFGGLSIYSSEKNAFGDEEVQLLIDLANNLAYGIITLRTSAEREQAEMALRESEERFRNATETVRDAFITLDGEGGVVTAWNPAAEAIFGYSQEEVIGRGIHEFLPPLRFREAARKGMAHFATTGEGAAINKTLELPAMHKNGTEFPIELSLSAMQIHGKWFATGIARDITERKQAELRLAEQIEELRRWHDATLGRELRTLELKREVNELLGQAGQPPRYPSAEQVE